jgi:hypothetical protein
MAAEWAQRFAIRAGKIVANDDRDIQRFSDSFDPADEIYGRADDGKIKSVRGSDVSVDCGPYVKGYDDFECWLAIAAKRFDRLDGLQRCAKCVLRCGADQIGTFNWKDRKQTIANELQDFTTVVVDSFGLSVKKCIEHRDDLLGRKAVGSLREAAQVR